MRVPGQEPGVQSADLGSAAAALPAVHWNTGNTGRLVPGSESMCLSWCKWCMESQNCRLVKVGKDHQDHSVQPPSMLIACMVQLPSDKWCVASPGSQSSSKRYLDVSSMLQVLTSSAFKLLGLAQSAAESVWMHVHVLACCLKRS